MINSFIFVCRSAASLLDAGHPAAAVHCAMAKKTATDYGTPTMPPSAYHDVIFGVCIDCDGLMVGWCVCRIQCGE
jgi:hypothetical protein